MRKVSFRSSVSVALWGLLILVGLIAAFLSGTGTLFILSALFLFYALQGLISELLGVSVERGGVSFPNRPFPAFTLLTFWRRSLPRGAFDRVDGFMGRKVAFFEGGTPVVVLLPNREDQRKFLSACGAAFPSVKISRL